MKHERNERVIEAIAAVLAGVATGDDHRLVAAWRLESERNEAFYQRITNKELLEENLEALRQEDVRSAWERVERLLDGPRQRRLASRWRYAAAAAATVLVAVPLTWWLAGRAPAAFDESPAAGAVAPDRVQLVLSDGTRIPVNTRDVSIIRDSAGTVILQEEGHLDYSRNEPPRDTAPLFNEITTGNGMEYAMTLADGTRVHLNAGSKLRFPVKFTGTRREVELEGEGYFEVARDPSRPFVARSGEMAVTVLGTTFNLRAYRDEPVIETTLVEGAVRVSDGESACRVVPGEQGVYHRDTRAITTRQVDVTLYTAWHRDEIKFKDMPLENVMRDLSRWYGIPHEFLDASARRIEFGGCFDRFKQIDPILDMLRRTELVEVVVREGTIYISKKK
jgi:ferric-dicitrate binding protein FerR (iron transport regulator)